MRKATPARVLNNEEILTEGLEELYRLDLILARLLAEGARPTLRNRDPGFHGLIQIVMAQQLSVASADAIWRRLVEHFGVLTPTVIEATQDEVLKACGLSAPKMRTLRAVCAAILNNTLPIDELAAVPADTAHSLLTAVKGIGPWTADIYLMFCLGHPDAFAAGDLALQEAAKIVYQLEARPSAAELNTLAERWRPWRAVAAMVLWAHYKLAKQRPGVSENMVLLDASLPNRAPKIKAPVAVIKRKARGPSKR